MLLASLGRTEEAYALLGECKGAPPQRRFELRMFSWRRARMRARMALAQGRKKERWWIDSLKMLYALNTAHAGSPYLEATKDERRWWATILTRQLSAQRLLDLATKLVRRSASEARLLCQLLRMFYPRHRQAKDAAKLLRQIK